MSAKQPHSHVDVGLSTPLRQKLDLDVGILYSGDNEAMSRLLSSVCRSLGDVGSRVVLIDNASTGDAAAWSRFAENVTMIRNVRPRRPAELINQLLEASSAPLLALVDGDAYFDPEDEGIARMVEFMHAHRDCAIAGCRWFDALGREMPPDRPFPRFWPVFEGPARGPYCFADAVAITTTPPLDCTWPSSPLLLLRRDALETGVGFADDRLSRDLAIADLCLRTRATGWRVLANHDVACHRLRLAGRRRLFDPRAWQRLRSSLRFMRKWGLNPHRRFHQACTIRRQPTTSQLALQLLGGTGFPESVDEGVYG